MGATAVVAAGGVATTGDLPPPDITRRISDPPEINAILYIKRNRITSNSWYRIVDVVRSRLENTNFHVSSFLFDAYFLLYDYCTITV